MRLRERANKARNNFDLPKLVYRERKEEMRIIGLNIGIVTEAPKHHDSNTTTITNNGSMIKNKMKRNKIYMVWL